MRVCADVCMRDKSVCVYVLGVWICGLIRVWMCVCVRGWMCVDVYGWLSVLVCVYSFCIDFIFKQCFKTNNGIIACETILLPSSNSDMVLPKQMLYMNQS